MITQSNTAIYVDMDKALTELKKSDKPSAKTDMQIFQCMANQANQDGTVDMRTSGIADTVGVRLSTVVTSAHRLEKQGFIKIGKESTPEGHGNILPRNVYTIAPKYLRKNTTENVAAPVSANLAASIQRAALAYINARFAVQAIYMERFDKLAEQLNNLADALNNTLTEKDKS